MKYILSIYFGYHDSCVTIANEKEILLHLEAERVFKKKHLRVDKEQMEILIAVALDHLNLSIEDIFIVYLAKWNNQFELENFSLFGKTFTPILTTHHNNHIGTAFPSGLNQSIVVCADGGSEDGTTKIYKKNGDEIELLEDLDSEIITGKFYGTITQIIVNPNFIRAHDTYPGRTMGLAGLGEFSIEFQNLIEHHKDKINSLHVTGCDDLRKVFGISNCYENISLDKKRRDLAFTAQKMWQDKFLEILEKYKENFDSVCLVGGCALNVSLNTALENSGWFKTVYVSPVSGDNGQSLGAILFHHHKIKCEYPYLGRNFGHAPINNEIIELVVSDLLQHKIIAWYDGRSEIGARALGNRSLLGLPDSIFMKKRLSEEIKRRESYRPVAAIVLDSFVNEITSDIVSSPYMTFAPILKKEVLGEIPAVVHFDGTCRLQTLSEHKNPLLYKIMDSLGQRTGYPVVMNSSLNIAGDAIVDTPEDAIDTFIRSGADVLYVNGKRYEKNNN